MAKTNLEKNDAKIVKLYKKAADGWANMFSGVGVKGVDRSVSNAVQRSLRLSEEDNRNLYRTDFGAKVINRPVDDMIRKWFDVTNDTDGDINNFLLNELCAQEAFKKGLTWGNVFGGSIVLMLIDDGATGDDALEQPLNENNIIEIKGLRVYDRYRATWQSSTDLYEDPKELKFGTPKFYRISALEPVPTTQFRVHESRVLRFDGPLTDDNVKSNNDWWNDSAYQKGFKALGDLEGTFTAGASIIDDFIQSVLQIEGLQNLIASGQQQVVKDRMTILDMSKHVLNTMLIDGKETFSKSGSSLTRLPELMQEFQQRVAGVYNIPMTLFMGRSPSGMNATGDADIKLYYDEIGNQQRIQMLKQAQRLVDLTMKSKQGPTNGQIIKDWKIVFNPIGELTEKEIAETKKLTSETDKNYVEMGAVDPNEVREARFGGVEYSSELQVKGGLEIPELPPEPQPIVPNTDSNEPTQAVGLPVKESGDTSTDLDHKHTYMLADLKKGNGKTSLDGKGASKHLHEIRNFTVLPYYGANGEKHTHDLPLNENLDDNSPTEIVGLPIKESGETSTVNNHKHTYMLADKKRGNGKTSLSGNGPSQHLHEVRNFTVMPYHGANGVSHTHELPESNPIKEVDPIRG